MHLRRAQLRLLAAVLFLGACSSDARETGDADPSSGIPLTTGTADTEADDDDAAQDDDDDTKLDTPSGEASGVADDGGGDQGCEKVDFLFVIDSSGSMEDEQDNLLASFPGFITAIEETLMIDDFQLMVIDAGLTEGSGCDGTLGAGRTTSGSFADCGIVGGNRFTTDSQPDLVQTFTCMASRGFLGPGDEQTMDSTLASIGTLNASGGCNEGFVRDDAVLVVTIISDEEDSPLDSSLTPPLDGSCEPADSDPNSLGDPDSWRDAIVAAKSGDASAVVMLALIGDCDAEGECPGIAFDPLDPNSEITGAEPAPRLRQLAQSFEFGSVGPVCASDYAPFFEQAVSVISTACDDFVPPS